MDRLRQAGVAALLLVGGLSGAVAPALPAQAQPAVSQRQILTDRASQIEGELRWIDMVTALAGRGEYFLVMPITGANSDVTVLPVHKDHLAHSIAVGVLTGTIPPENASRAAQAMLDRSARNVEFLQERRRELMQERLSIQRQLQALGGPSPPRNPPAIQPGPSRPPPGVAVTRPPGPAAATGALVMPGPGRRLAGEWSMNCVAFQWGGPAEAVLEGSRITGTLNFGGSAEGDPIHFEGTVQYGVVSGGIGGPGGQITGRVTGGGSGPITAQGGLDAKSGEASCTGSWRMSG